MTMQQQQQRPNVSTPSSSSSSPSSSSAKTSLATLILVGCTFLGVGALGGYLVFYGFWNQKCAALLTRTRHAHNATVVSLERQHARLTTELKDCMERSSSSSTAEDGMIMSSKMQELLVKHHALLDKHESTLQQLSAMEKERGTSKEDLDAVRSQVDKLQRERSVLQMETSQIQQQCNREKESLKSQLQLAQSMMRNKVDEVESLKANYINGDCTTKFEAYEKEIATFQANLRQRNTAQTILAYGQPPYRVQFSLDLPRRNDHGDDENSFVVEFSTLQDMPHSIFTFLHLVEHRMYAGTTLGFTTLQQPQSHGDSSKNPTLVLSGGDPQTSSRNKQVQSRLMRRYAEHGYDVSKPLLVEESSPRALCLEHAFGFVQGTGPAFMIPLSSSSQPQSALHAAQHCPGRVIQGWEALVRLQQMTASADRVTILSAQVLRGSSGATIGGSDEL